MSTTSAAAEGAEPRRRPTGPRQPTLPALTGYRFLAAGSIVALHSSRVSGLRLGSVEFLGYAVSFFYILSGFILSYVHPTIEGAAARKAFWIARFARIWPLHLFAFALLLLSVPSATPADQGHPIVLGAIHLVLLQSWLVSTRRAEAFNGVAWSLSVEAFFYLMFPFLIGPMRDRPGRILLLSLAARALLYGVSLLLRLPVYSVHGPSAVDLLLTLPLSRLFEFVLGMAVYRLWISRGSARLAPGVLTACELFVLTLLGVACAWWPADPLTRASWVDHTTGLFVVPPLVALFLGWLVYLGADGRGLVSRLLSRPFCVLLGEISFSLYMLHYVVFRALDYRGFFDRLPWQLSLTAYLVMVVIVSWLTWRLIELPARRYLVARLTPKRPRLDPAS